MDAKKLEQAARLIIEASVKTQTERDFLKLLTVRENVNGAIRVRKCQQR
jgi:hypothetical protein